MPHLIRVYDHPFSNLDGGAIFQEAPSTPRWHPQLRGNFHVEGPRPVPSRTWRVDKGLHRYRVSVKGLQNNCKYSHTVRNIYSTGALIRLSASI